MKRLPSLITWLISALIVEQAAAQTPGKLEAFGLPGRRVIALAGTRYVSPSETFLYAATEDSGVYRRSLALMDSTWSSLGLKGKKLTALDIQIWGAGPAIFHTPVVGVAPDYAHGDSTLVYRWEDNHWVPSDSGILKKPRIESLASFATSGHEPPGATFATDGGLIYRSNSLRRGWTKIFNFGLGWHIYVTAVTQHYGRDEIWVGGISEGAIAWSANSADYGETWKQFYPPSPVLDGNAFRSWAIHPDSSNIVYAGMYGAVIKTTNGGKSWQLTGLEKNQTYLHGLALDSFDPNHIYAGGARANQWAMWESFNAGITWQEIPAPSTIGDTQGISSLVADAVEPGVIYIGTFAGGIWRYQNKRTAVHGKNQIRLAQDFVLEQNYPNPFNASTAIRFAITVKLANQPVRLAIYNLRGELVRELINKKLPAGYYDAHWEGRDDAGHEMASGIYLYRLQVGNMSEIRKLTLLR